MQYTYATSAYHEARFLVHFHLAIRANFERGVMYIIRRRASFATIRTLRVIFAYNKEYTNLADSGMLLHRSDISPIFL